MRPGSHMKLSYLTTVCVIFSFFLFFSWEVSLFPSILYHCHFLFVWRVPRTFSFRILFFYFVTRGWIFISANAKIQSFNHQSITKDFAYFPTFGMERFQILEEKETVSIFELVEMDVHLEVAARPLPNFGKLESLELESASKVYTRSPFLLLRGSQACCLGRSRSRQGRVKLFRMMRFLSAAAKGRHSQRRHDPKRLYS